jgi:hypothetical protein
MNTARCAEDLERTGHQEGFSLCYQHRYPLGPFSIEASVLKLHRSLRMRAA